MRRALSSSFIGSPLNNGQAILTIIIAPAFWLVASIAWAALPA